MPQRRVEWKMPGARVHPVGLMPAERLRRKYGRMFVGKRRQTVVGIHIDVGRVIVAHDRNRGIHGNGSDFGDWPGWVLRERRSAHPRRQHNRCNSTRNSLGHGLLPEWVFSDFGCKVLTRIYFPAGTLSSA